MGAAVASRGIDVHSNNHFTTWLSDTGFTNIREDRVKWPLGPWAKDKFWKKFGVINLNNMLQGVEGMSMAVLMRLKGWSEEEVKDYLGGVRADLKDSKTHYHMNM